MKFNWQSVLLLISILGISMIIISKQGKVEQNKFELSGISDELKDSIAIALQKRRLSPKIDGHNPQVPINEPNSTERWIYMNASVEELIALTKLSIGFKKLAYEALIKRDHHLDKFEIIKSGLNDTTSIVYLTSGCEIKKLLIGEYLIEEVIFLVDNGLKPPGMPEQLGFSDDELRILKASYNLRKSKKWEYIMADKK